jgi:6-pyruvoyltetrahydropterin/6-carboxytetrahydropterin synthase
MRLHGHNYRVEIVLEAEKLDEHGFVVDYNDLRQFRQLIDNVLDHQHLNDVLNVNPTAENLARWLFVRAKSWWEQTVAVRVSETPNTWAEYSEPLTSSSTAEPVQL